MSEEIYIRAKKDYYEVVCKDGEHDTILVRPVDIIGDEEFVRITRGNYSAYKSFDITNGEEIKLINMVKGKKYFVKNCGIADSPIVGGRNEETVGERFSEKTYSIGSIDKKSVGIVTSSGKIAKFSRRNIEAFYDIISSKDIESNSVGEFRVEVGRNSGNREVIKNEVSNKYKAIASICDMKDRTVGYRLQNTGTGEIVDAEIPKIEELANKGYITNIEYVETSSGKNYLRGNGCSLEALNKIYMT